MKLTLSLEDIKDDVLYKEERVIDYESLMQANSTLIDIIYKELFDMHIKMIDSKKNKNHEKDNI